MNEEKRKLIAKLDAARSMIYNLLPELNRSQEVYPGWIVKDLLGHIAGWDEAVIDMLRAHQTGAPPSTPAAQGIDFYNALSTAKRKDLDYEVIFKEWMANRQEMKRLIIEMPDEKLDEPLLLPWAGMGSVAQVIGIFSHHETTHVAEIRQALGLES